MDTAYYRVLPESSNEGYRSETVFEINFDQRKESSLWVTILAFQMH